MKGKKWRELRNILSPAFTGSKMRAIFVLISEAAKEFAKYFENQNLDVCELEMKETYSKYTNDVIATCAFGIKSNSLEDPTNEFFTMGRAITSTSLSGRLKALLLIFFPKFFKILKLPAVPVKVTSFFKTIITGTIALREKENIIRPDLIHLMIEAKKGKLFHDIQQTKDTGFATVEEIKDSRSIATLELTDDVITAQALIFFLAGFETSSSLLSFVSYELAKCPDIQYRLIREVDDNTSKEGITYENISKMKYLDQVVSEALRKWTAGYALSRVCTKDYTIPPKNEDEVPLKLTRGCYVMIPIIGIHHDPKYFKNPDIFDPERFSDENKKKIVPGSFMPFGSGPRNCIGSRFALLEIKALLVSMLTKFEFRFIEKTKIPLTFTKTFNMNVKGGIWLGLKKRENKQVR
ncbi:hypothetical protein HHI36_014750 [Cryptolaemus montrouzieri]|uniref:Cytochrome P450 n=1 Tax=Cryptolaemus montrouzieri TaxID=559131 RepID=A0ABD2N4D8_9CUCU